MNILVACEFSGVVRDAFIAKGHNAWSCDILPGEGEHRNKHIMDRVENVLNIDYMYKLPNGVLISADKYWDMLIAHPPCTHLAVSGARWFPEKIKDGRQQKAIDFFMLFANFPCKKVVIENPVSIMSTKWRKPDQIIQPWQFGHGETKKTCLWLKNLPKLAATKIVSGREQRIWKMSPSENRAKLRSITYKGIAEAMANQWGVV